VDNTRIDKDSGEELRRSLRMVNKDVTMDYGFHALNMNSREK
jgi:hypothetical protein